MIQNDSIQNDLCIPITSRCLRLDKKFTNELTKQYLKIGYQRQLTNRHKDESFSAFGLSFSDTTGGTWLTACVLRCFA